MTFRCVSFIAMLFVWPAFAEKPQNHILFVENKGQIRDVAGRPNTEVLYLYATGNFRLQLRQNGWSYEFADSRLSDAAAGSEPALSNTSHRFHRIDVFIDGASNRPVVVTGQPAAFPLHFFGPDAMAITHVNHFNKITYYNILPAIDLEFSLTPKGTSLAVKYSFVVHAGASAADIKLNYCSSDASLKTEGALHMETPLGRISESRPWCFSGNPAEGFWGDFIVEGNTVSFSVPDSPDLPLVIDPVLTYATYFGGENIDYSEDMKLDAEGNIVVTGRTASATNIATSGAYSQTYNGGSFDIFLFKFNPQFQMQWATYFGGNRVDYAWALDMDHAGRIYLGGEAYSNGLATAGAEQSVVNGLESDGLLARFSSNGMLQWCRYYGGGDKDQILSIALDGSGRIVATGYTLSNDSITTAGAHMTTYGGKGDIFLAAFDTAAGNIVWGTYYGADKDDRGHHVAISPSGSIYLTGTALSKTGIATAGANQSQGANLIDAFLAKFSPDGFPVWGTYVAGAYEDRGRDCLVDLDGNIVVTGFTQSDTGFTTAGAWQTDHVFGIDSTGYFTLDAFLQKYDSNGVLLWGTYFGDTLSETVRGLTINSHNEILICGATFSAQGIAHGNAWQTQLGGVSDAWFAKFRPDGQLVYSSYFGGSGDEQVGGYGLNIETDAANRIYLCSATTSDDSIATPGAFQTYRAGNYDVFLARFDDKCYDRYEPNNTMTTAAAISVQHDPAAPVHHAAIASATDNDFYTFNVDKAGQQLLVFLSALAADYDLMLYNASGNLIGNSQNAGLQDETISLGLTTAGAYFISIIPATATQFNDSLCYTLQAYLDSSLFTAAQMPDNNLTGIVFPNPFSESVWVRPDLPGDGPLQLTMYNAQGKLIFNKYLCNTHGGTPVLVELPSLPAGLYVFAVQRPEGLYLEKLICNPDGTRHGVLPPLR